jgi:hypothetical protein
MVCAEKGRPIAVCGECGVQCSGSECSGKCIVECSAVQCSAVWSECSVEYSAVQCNAVWSEGIVKCSAVQCSAVQCSAEQSGVSWQITPGSSRPGVSEEFCHYRQQSPLPGLHYTVLHCTALHCTLQCALCTVHTARPPGPGSSYRPSCLCPAAADTTVSPGGGIPSRECPSNILSWLPYFLRTAVPDTNTVGRNTVTNCWWVPQSVLGYTRVLD